MKRLLARDLPCVVDPPAGRHGCYARVGTLLAGYVQVYHQEDREVSLHTVGCGMDDDLCCRINSATTPSECTYLCTGWLLKAPATCCCSLSTSAATDTSHVIPDTCGCCACAAASCCRLPRAACRRSASRLWQRQYMHRWHRAVHRRYTHVLGGSTSQLCPAHAKAVLLP